MPLMTGSLLPLLTSLFLSLKSIAGLNVNCINKLDGHIRLLFGVLCLLIKLRLMRAWCQFADCNQSVLNHSVTLRSLFLVYCNYGESLTAIVAFLFCRRYVEFLLSCLLVILSFSDPKLRKLIRDEMTRRFVVFFFVNVVLVRL